MRTTLLSTLLLPLLAGCAALRSGSAEADTAPPDPRTEKVVLPSHDDWEARLLWAGDSGVWTVETREMMPSHAGEEIIALDDRGRCLLFSLNSTKVSEWQACMDGEWLGALAHGDLDPLYTGDELYVAGAGGNLYQVFAHPSGGFDTAVIHRFAGREVHTLFIADLDPGREGRELYACLLTGEVLRVDPDALPGGRWKTDLVFTSHGRIRDAVVYRLEGEEHERVATVGRSGQVLELYRGDDGLESRELYRAPQGLARIAMGSASGRPPVLYVVGDDGAVRQLVPGSGGRYATRVIHSGPEGGRGIAVGRFDGDTDKESLAIFGYSGNVEILRPATSSAWTKETIFTDVDKGHWLAVTELDDRNNTNELLLAGYSGRVVLLSQKPARP